jgi:hypothetical protein
VTLLTFLSAKLGWKFSRTNLSIIVLILLAMQVIDLSIGSLADILKPFTISFWGQIFFILLAAIAWCGQYLMLDMIKEKNKAQQIKKTNFNVLEKLVLSVQIILTAILVLLLYQIIFISQFNTDILNTGSIVSGGLAVYLMGEFAYWLLSWFRRTRSLMLLFFGLAMSVIAFTIISMVVLFNLIWILKPGIFTPNSEVVFIPLPELQQSANTVQTYSGVIAFILVWAGTVLLLRHNIHRIGNVKFWALLSTPIIIFSTSYLSLYQSLASTFSYSVLLVIYSGIAASALIGIAFRYVAKPLGDTPIKDFMIITSYGFILFFTTMLASPSIGYPPFGFVNVLLVGPFAFLILNGLYRSAISVAEDVNLRLSIKNTTRADLKLLDDIGTAEMYKDIESKVTRLTKANADLLTEQSGIEPSLTDDEVRNYLEFVTKEIKKQ